MESKAENIIQNVGAIAETVSVFYNSMAGQVPKDVALILTQHFMNLTIARRSMTPAQLAQAAAQAQLRELRRKETQQTPQTEPEKPENPQTERSGDGDVPEK